jgi:undecaprenyl-diphosphatase
MATPHSRPFAGVARPAVHPSVSTAAARRARCVLLGLMLLVTAAVSHAPVARAGGGPLGIDSRLSYDNSGIWKRSNQNMLIDGMMGVVGLGALWEGGEDRLGKAFWQSVDAAAASGLASIALKYAFSRERPSQTADPNRWFTGHGQSFPSGEVTVTSALVTPFVLEYASDHPAVYALEALPVYDAIARMKTRGHWQTDVIAGFALGFASGYFLHRPGSPFVWSIMPHGVQVGFKKQF